MTDNPAIEAMAVALWERDPEMSAPSDALGRAESVIQALAAAGFAVVPVEDLRDARWAMPRGSGYRGLKHRLDAMIAAATPPTT